MQSTVVLKNARHQRSKWLGVTNMSSEESGDVTVHPLPWRSDYVSAMFSKIDSYILNHKSAQAKKQMKSRKSGSPSSSSAPSSAHEWALAKASHE